MIELETTDPRINTAMNLLLRRLAAIVQRNPVKISEPLGPHMLKRLQDTITDHRSSFRQQHRADFPQLTIFVLPSIPFVVCYRADLDSQEIRNKLLMLLRQLGERGIQVSAFEVADAVKAAWPHYQVPIEEYRTDPKLKMELQ